VEVIKGRSEKQSPKGITKEREEKMAQKIPLCPAPRHTFDWKQPVDKELSESGTPTARVDRICS